MVRAHIGLGAALLLVGACTAGPESGKSSQTQNPAPFDEAPTAIRAGTALVAADGKAVGSATFVDTRQGVRVDVKVVDVPPGEHGIHIHAAGRCESPGFTTAGGHFNPGGKKHGLETREGPHAGDLPNLTVRPDGKGELTHYNPHVTLTPASSNGLLFGAGTALVIHAGADDNTSDPAGNSGDRIACGVIKQVGL
jgi:Cu-Zn family superoxide dismutase